MRKQLKALLLRAKTAHTEWEKEFGTDPNWPRWYAQWLLDNGVSELLGAPVHSTDTLAYYLEALRPCQVDWYDYAADKLVRDFA